jgi:hypothetical protein
MEDGGDANCWVMRWRCWNFATALGRGQLVAWHALLMDSHADTCAVCAGLETALTSYSACRGEMSCRDSLYVDYWIQPNP